MKFIKDIYFLFVPKTCAICFSNLFDKENIICATCNLDLPLVNNGDFKTNAITNLLYGRVQTEAAAALLYYRKTGKTKDLIEQLKYNKNQAIGIFLGNWFGSVLKKSNQFNEIDYIIPVPLHKIKRKKRGFNQLTKFGVRLGKILKTKYLEGVLIRKFFTETQTLKQRLERFKNAETIFYLTDKKLLQNKHVLLIDDVITTGATIEACCKELLKTSGLKISIATMALTD